MKLARLFGIAATTLAVCTSAHALYTVANHGTWPKTWPAELEPLRKQARTLVGPQVAQSHYEIPFTTREQFEAVWPHILKVKSKGAPIILLRGPDSRLGKKIGAGVRIHCPPPESPNDKMPKEPLDSPNVRVRWMYKNFIELVVDEGGIVDLKRIPMPPDTPIVDERFTKDASPAAKTQ